VTETPSSEDPTDDKIVDLLFDLSNDNVSGTMTRVQSLQGRGGQAFAAATVLIGFATLANSPDTAVNWPVSALLIVGAVAYLLAAGASLWRDYRTHSARATKVALLKAMARDALTNLGVVKTAERAARWAVRFVAIEGGAVALAIAIAHLWPIPAK
jgi:hypothetical protein